MKRDIAFLLALALLLTFSGCGKIEEEDRSFDSMRSFTRYSPMVRAAETSNTIYFIGRSDTYLKYVDKTNGISGILCGRLECHHNNRDCNGYLGNFVWDIFVNGGRLYWVSGSTASTLYSIKQDGTDRRVEAELPKEMIPNHWQDDRHCTLHDGRLYFCALSAEIVNGEEKYYNYVAAFPISSNEEPFVILKEETPAYLVNYLSMQFYGKYLYILTSTESCHSEDSASLYDCELRRWDVETGELEVLYEDAGSPLCNTKDLWVTDESVFFNRQTSGVPPEGLETRIYRYDFDTGECEYCFDNGLYGRFTQGIIADNLVTGHEIVSNDDGIYNLFVMLKDFEGNVLVNKIYTLDIRDGYCGFDGNDVDFLGRDEEYAYYSFYAQDLIDEGYTSYISMIAVALDGSGARVMCTQTEDTVYGT